VILIIILVICARLLMQIVKIVVIQVKEEYVNIFYNFN